jgi:hypothetical protein
VNHDEASDSPFVRSREPGLASVQVGKMDHSQGASGCRREPERQRPSVRSTNRAAYRGLPFAYFTADRRMSTITMADLEAYKSHRLVEQKRQRRNCSASLSVGVSERRAHDNSFRSHAQGGQRPSRLLRAGGVRRYPDPPTLCVAAQGSVAPTGRPKAPPGSSAPN